MKNIIAQLRTLNDLDLKLQSRNRDLARLPRELSALEDEARRFREQVERMKKEGESLWNEVTGLEEELKVGVQALKRYSSQLNMLKSTKEFDTMRRSMDSQKNFNNKLDQKIKEVLSQSEALEKETGEQVKKMAEGEKKLAKERERISREIRELEADQKEDQKHRDLLAQQIPDKELAIYNRIVATRGEAMASIKEGVCAACNMKLPPQTQNLVILAKNLVNCPSCNRILVAEK